MTVSFYADEDTKTIYVKELKIAFFTKHPEKSYLQFLDIVDIYAKKGYHFKDKREDRNYSKEVEELIYNKLHTFP